MGEIIVNKLRENRFAFIVSILHWLLTFYLERLVLVVAPTEHLFTYCACKAILLVLLFGFWRMIWRGLFSPDRRTNREFPQLIVALAFLAVLAVWFYLRHPLTLPMDEQNLFDRATRLDDFAYWFNYPSGYYWIMGIMLIPHYLGPVWIKMGLQALLAGYCYARQRERSGTWRALPIVGLFLLPFVLTQGISAHRLPTYGVLYLFLVAKLVYDRLDNCRLDTATLVMETAMLAVLAIWRSEGIYFSVLGLILIAVAYRVPIRKASLKKAAVYALIFVMAVLPQLSAYFNAAAPLSLRAKPLYGYVLCNMFRNGLTEEMIAEEREDIELYLPLSAVHSFNEMYGDGNYEAAYIMNNVLPDVEYADQERFCAAVKQVCIKNLPIYFKSQFNAWIYTNSQYPVGSDVGLVRSIVNLSSKVWIPTLLVFVLCIAALVKRWWLTFWLTGGAIGNWLLVVTLMPAAYAKYFYVDYLLGYFLLFMGLCQLLSNAKKEFYA